MKLSGKIYKNSNVIIQTVKEINDDKISFREKLESLLISICKEFDISVPLWLKKNTTELGVYRKTSFPKDQFLENVWFDKFEISIDYV